MSSPDLAQTGTSAESHASYAPVAALEWSATPWEPSAPESYLLLHFQRPEPKEALKLAMLELIARHRFRLEEVEQRGFFGRRHKGSVLVHGTSDAPLSPVLDFLWTVFQRLPVSTFATWRGDPSHRAADTAGLEIHGVEVKDYAQAVVKETGSVEGFLTDRVRPALAERGWIESQRHRVLGLFPTTRWTLTPAGVAAQGDLLWRVEYGNRELGHLVDDDPQRALAFAGLAGAAVLLMDDARPHLQRLRERLAAGSQPTTDAVGGGIMAASDTSGTWDVTAGATPDALGPANPPLDLGAAPAPGTIDTGFDFGAALDLSAFDGIDAAVSAVDAGVDAAAGADGGGGGDGGGGADGGGS